jgi:hypothetical protein
VTRRGQYAPPPPGVRLPAYIQLFAVVIYGTRPVFDFLIKWDEIGESRIAEKHHRADARLTPDARRRGRAGEPPCVSWRVLILVLTSDYGMRPGGVSVWRKAAAEAAES